MKIVYYNCNILLLLSISIFVKAKEIFELRADYLIDTLLDNVYKGKFQKSLPVYKITTKILRSTSQKLITSTKIPGITKHPAMNTHSGNMTMEDLTVRKRNIDLKVLMDSNTGRIPNFNENDEIEAQTRRFNKVNELAIQDNTLREHYFNDDNGTFIFIEKNRTISLMAQFVYETRYLLPYAQRIRKKYINNIRYKIGYCFALLRTLKQQQMLIFNTIKINIDKFQSVYLHIKLYEKIVKLNVDIRDLMKFIIDLDKMRQREIDDRTSTRKPRG